MTKKKSPSDVLAQLSADDALAVLRTHRVARDETIAPRIRQVAETYLERNAPMRLKASRRLRKTCERS